MEVPEVFCLDDELECTDLQEPIQIDAEKAENYGEVLVELEQEEISILGKDLAPVVDEPMPQVLPPLLLHRH